MRIPGIVPSVCLPLALLLLAAPLPGSAQVGMIPDEECRCVDPDGNEIENCRCFRTLDRGQFAWTLSNLDPSRPRIGITLSTSDYENESRGATIQEVMEDGPADRAGLQEGDVITHLNGQSLFDPLQDEEAEAGLDLDGSLPAQRLLHIARDLEPGDEVEVRYLRDGSQGATTLTAEDLKGWGGNYVFFREGVEGQWNPGDFPGAWNIQEYSGNWKEAMEQFHNQWDSEGFHQQWKESMEEFQEQWDLEESPGVWQEMLDQFREQVEAGEFRGHWKEMTDKFEGEWHPEEFLDHWQEMIDEYEDQNQSNFRFYSPEGEGDIVIWNKDEAPNIAFEAFTEGEPFNFYFGRVAGLQLEELNPDLGEYFGTERGVLVTDVEEDSTLGLKAGDVVLRVGDREVTDPGRFRKILSSYDADEEVTLHIMRQKVEMTVSGTMGR